MSSTLTADDGAQSLNHALDTRSSGNAKKRYSRRVAVDILGFFDAAAVICGALLPAYIFTATAEVTVMWPQIAQAAIVAAIIASVCLHAWRAYDTTQLHDFPVAPAQLLMALTIAIVALLGLALPFAPKDINLWLWYSIWISLSFTLLLANRTIARKIFAQQVAAGRFDLRVAVYGAGNIARRVRDHLAAQKSGIHFMGVFDDRNDTGRIDSDGLELSGALEDLVAAGRTDQLDQVIVALPQSASSRISDIVRELERLPVSVHIVTHMASDLVPNVSTHTVSALGPVGMLDVKKKPLSDWAPLLKATEDFVLGGLFTLLAVPLFIIIAIAVKLETKGPVFFIQRRHGLNKRIINVYKFRTMRVMEDGQTVTQATSDDPRTTRVGHILRRTSLDEIPQLINVLKGEMSLVGPRPHALVHDEQWGEMLETYANRHQVKPGITGWAQVNGYRGIMDTTDKIEQRISHDLHYIHNWSLWLDLKILFFTMFAVVSAKNAH